MTATLSPAPETVVLHVGGLQYATEKAVIDQVLGRRPGVLAVDANPVAQTATVTFDPARTSIEELRRWVEECGKHCAGQSVPGHICDPMAEGAATHEGMAHDHAAMQRADAADGHGQGGHAGMSMASTLPRRARVHHPHRRLVDGRDEAARHRARNPVRHRP